MFSKVVDDFASYSTQIKNENDKSSGAHCFLVHWSMELKKLMNWGKFDESWCNGGQVEVKFYSLSFQRASTMIRIVTSGESEQEMGFRHHQQVLKLVANAVKWRGGATYQSIVFVSSRKTAGNERKWMEWGDSFHISFDKITWWLFWVQTNQSDKASSSSSSSSFSPSFICHL